jgi:dihydropteroate synthase
MGIVNVTPDSFSDGGRYVSVEEATAHALRLVGEGATVIDIGGESTRPGSVGVSERAELDRVMPVVAAVRGATQALISVDTTKSAVADRALEAGVDIVNDVTGGRDDQLLDVVASYDAGLVLMHMRGEPRTMQDDPHYDDVVIEVADHLARSVERAVARGVRQDAILVDPGIGFGKTADHNFALLANVAELERRAGAPVVVGASRKRSLARLVGDELAARDDATLAVSVVVFAQGAAMVRVHDVRPSVLAARWIDRVGVAA